MKKRTLNAGIVTIILMFVCSLTIQGVSPRNYLYDTKEENGKIVSKVIFLQEDGLLNKQVKYEFTYNEAGKVAEKKAYRWNDSREQWDPYYLISYQYEETSDNIHSNYGMWNSKKSDYSLNMQTILVPLSSYDDIFS